MDIAGGLLLVEERTEYVVCLEVFIVAGECEAL